MTGPMRAHFLRTLPPAVLAQLREERNGLMFGLMLRIGLRPGEATEEQFWLLRRYLALARQGFDGFGKAVGAAEEQRTFQLQHGDTGAQRLQPRSPAPACPRLWCQRR